MLVTNVPLHCSTGQTGNTLFVCLTGSGCCLSACQMCRNPRQLPEALKLLSSWWWVQSLSEFLFGTFPLCDVIYWQPHDDFTSLFYCAYLNVLCHALCLPSISKFKQTSVKPVCSSLCVWILLVNSHVTTEYCHQQPKVKLKYKRYMWNNSQFIK